MEQYDNYEKANQLGLDEVLSFSIEEGRDVSDGQCINAQN